MWQDKLKEIIYILENSNVNEIEVSFWGRKFRVSKQAGVVFQDPAKTSQIVNMDNENQSKGQKSKVIDDKQPNVQEANKYENLLSPMPGTFYSSPTPDDDPFVKKGDMVKKGQTLCIIEAMKIMNEIESEFDGKIIDIGVNNGESVEYNQQLFQIKPS